MSQINDFREGKTYVLAVVDSAVLEGTLADPRGDEESGDTNTETVKVESDHLTIGSLLGVGEVVSGGHADW